MGGHDVFRTQQAETTSVDGMSEVALEPRLAAALSRNSVDESIDEPKTEDGDAAHDDAEGAEETADGGAVTDGAAAAGNGAADGGDGAAASREADATTTTTTTLSTEEDADGDDLCEGVNGCRTDASADGDVLELAASAVSECGAVAVPAAPLPPVPVVRSAGVAGCVPPVPPVSWMNRRDSLEMLSGAHFDVDDEEEYCDDLDDLDEDEDEAPGLEDTNVIDDDESDPRGGRRAHSREDETDGRRRRVSGKRGASATSHDSEYIDFRPNSPRVSTRERENAHIVSWIRDGRRRRGAVRGVSRQRSDRRGGAGRVRARLRRTGHAHSVHTHLLDRVK